MATAPGSSAFLRSCVPAFLRSCVPFIAGHVPAKRCLVATDPAYLALLGPVSVVPLRAQGGPMDERGAAEFAAHPLAADAVALRRWDDAAKDPDAARCCRCRPCWRRMPA
ncbi:hypothetical protein AB0E10_04255 [Streptomyces sp. NPDC048045]|uniref:hypothetical protein n=1 Tax=Streptomyces sp. NPDC048045 TaxID=3154710 RepID=UPI00343CAC12